MEDTGKKTKNEIKLVKGGVIDPKLVSPHRDVHDD
jgi:hypothetical protein